MTAIAQLGTTFEDGTYAIEEVADDPFVARFLSPDPFIQSPGNSQNYNRYSYALNNPLKYTDPSGYKYRGADMGFNPGGFFNHGFKLPQNGTMGSGSHWSDGMMGEYHDFVFGSSKKFDAKYGVGAHNIGWSVWSDSYLAEKWRADDISIYDVETVEVFEVKTKTENWVGTEKNPYQILVSTDEVTSYELVVKGNELNGEADDGDNVSTGLSAGSMLAGAAGYRIGSHMSGVSRFGPLYWNNGVVYRQALRGYRFGPIPGAAATKLGAGLRIGGNILGGFGIAYTGYQMYQGNISRVKGGFDIGFGVVGFLGPVGLGVSAVYFVGDTFIPGGWQAVPSHMYNQIQRNSYEGVWLSPYNHYK